MGRQGTLGVSACAGRGGARWLALALAISVASCGGSSSSKSDTDRTLDDVTFANGTFVTVGKGGRIFK